MQIYVLTFLFEVHICLLNNLHYRTKKIKHDQSSVFILREVFHCYISQSKISCQRLAK